MDDYFDTAQRIYNDITILRNSNKWFNTCYLSGYIMECYEKIILNEVLNVPNARGFSHDVDRMADEIHRLYTAYLVGGGVPSKYIVDIRRACASLFDGDNSWHPTKRYRNQTTIWGQTIAELFYNETDGIMMLLLEMELDGAI